MRLKACFWCIRSIIISFADMIANTRCYVLLKLQRNNLVIKLRLIHHYLTICTIIGIVCITVICVYCSVISNIAAFTAAVHSKAVKVCACILAYCACKSCEYLVFIINAKSKNVIICIANICFDFLYTFKGFFCVINSFFNCTDCLCCFIYCFH